MADYNYRFSIVPAPAVVDKELSHIAFRVLCILGRHTNDAGWCSRSQVKMAAELGVGRSTIYDAMQILYESAYVERRPNGRGSRDHVEGEHPFSSYSYRVKLDRDDLPGRIKDAIGDDEGAAGAAGGAGTAAGGAGLAAPLEGISSEGISSKPERESARAREELPVAKFLKKWPTAAVDDQTKITKAWQGLTADDQHAAIDGIDTFLAALKAHSKKHIPSGWKYLDERKWQLLEVPAQSEARVDIKTWSREWWAALLMRISKGLPTSFMIRYATEHSGGSWTLDHPTEEQAQAFIAYAANGPEIAAWRPWFDARGIRFPTWEGRFSVFLPSPAPPTTDEHAIDPPFSKTG